MMRYWLFLILISPASSMFAQPFRPTFEITPYGGLHGYGWKEFDANGQQALKESGPRYQFGVLSRVSFLRDRQLFVDADLRYTTGLVDYDGFLMDQLGNRTPYTTKTGYSGFEATASTGYAFKLASDAYLAPLAGFGFEFWNRDLDNGGPQGYDEKYTVVLATVGTEFVYLVSPSYRMFSMVGMRLPLSISESINLAARGQGGPADINLSPGINPRFIVQAGGTVYSVHVSFFFETWTLSASPADKGFHQPESTRTYFGLNIGYTIGVM